LENQDPWHTELVAALRRAVLLLVGLLLVALLALVVVDQEPVPLEHKPCELLCKEFNLPN
jgi:hypothetical protein